MKKHIPLIIFNITFLVGYIFRILTFGWFMFVLMIPEYVFRTGYYLGGYMILKRNMVDKKYFRSNVLQILYLLTSFFSFDGGDINSYTFAHLWINPPSYIAYCWMALALATIIFLFAFIVKNFREHSDTSYIKITPFVLYAIYGAVVTPVLAALIIVLGQKIF